MWASQQLTPSGILCRCDLDLIKNLTSNPEQIKPKLPRCSFCLCVTFGSGAAFATGPRESKHNEGRALRAWKFSWGSARLRHWQLRAHEKTTRRNCIKVNIFNAKSASVPDVPLPLSWRAGNRGGGGGGSGTAHKGKMSSVHQESCLLSIFCIWGPGGRDRRTWRAY